MATTTSKRSAVAAAVLLALLVVAAVVVGPAEASTLTVFTGPGCAGRSRDVNGCGCFDISAYQAGFHFVYTEGQKMTLYSARGCNPRFPHRTFSSEARRCDNTGDYRSVKMHCGTEVADVIEEVVLPE